MDSHCPLRDSSPFQVLDGELKGLFGALVLDSIGVEDVRGFSLYINFYSRFYTRCKINMICDHTTFQIFLIRFRNIIRSIYIDIDKVYESLLLHTSPKSFIQIEPNGHPGFKPVTALGITFGLRVVSY